MKHKQHKSQFESLIEDLFNMAYPYIPEYSCRGYKPFFAEALGCIASEDKRELKRERKYYKVDLQKFFNFCYSKLPNEPILEQYSNNIALFYSFEGERFEKKFGGLISNVVISRDQMFVSVTVRFSNIVTDNQDICDEIVTLTFAPSTKDIKSSFDEWDRYVILPPSLNDFDWRLPVVEGIYTDSLMEQILEKKFGEQDAKLAKFVYKLKETRVSSDLYSIEFELAKIFLLLPQYMNFMTEEKNSHKTRMSELGKIAMPDPDSATGKALIEILKNQREEDPNIEKEIRKRHKQSRKIFAATMENGAGYVADQVLRYFLAEYVTRLENVGLRKLPSSFNVMEAFYRYDMYLAHFRILPEKDYLISVEDFLDFATGINSPKEDISAAYKLKEDVIHSYTAFDDPRTCMFMSGDGEEFGICSVSMVRRGDELSIMLVAGKTYNEDDKKSAIELLKNVKLNFTKQELDRLSKFNKQECDLVHPANAPELWQNRLLVRFDLKSKTHSARYLMQETTRGFIILHDDPDLLLLSEIKSKSERLEKYATLFELAKTSVLIPAYIDYRKTYIKTEQVHTNFGKRLKNSFKRRKDANSLSKDERIIIRRISAVRIINQGISRPVGRTYTPPQFQVNVSGFWRYFANKEWMGRDEKGNPVQGKTWVKGHTRYQDKNQIDDDAKVVYIKSKIPNSLQHNKTSHQSLPLSTRKVTTEATVIQQSTIKQTTIRREYLYVLVNPAHRQGLFKVGYTTRNSEERAKELSSHTGVPAHYLVVESWLLSDGKEAERRVHEALKGYRLSENREFFQIDYQDLRRIIINTVKDMLI